MGIKIDVLELLEYIICDFNGDWIEMEEYFYFDLFYFVKDWLDGMVIYDFCLVYFICYLVFF